MYSLGTWFSSGTCVCLDTLHKGKIIMIVIIIIIITIISHVATAPSGLGSGQCGGSTITLRQTHTLVRTPLDE
jgi:hypothetical protein